jgi:hypothetical protein
MAIVRENNMKKRERERERERETPNALHNPQSYKKLIQTSSKP